MAVGFFGKLLFKKGASKLSPTIISVTPNVPVTKGQKLKRDLKIATQKSKAAGAKLDNTMFRIDQEKKKLEKMKTEKKAKGGRIGYKAGSKKGKVPTTPKEKAFGMLSVKAKRDNNPNITLTDKIVGATKA